MDKVGQTVAFRLSSRRDVAAAKVFFKKAIGHERSAAAHDHPGRLCRFHRALPPQIAHRQSVPEQPHRAGPSRDLIQNPPHACCQSTPASSTSTGSAKNPRASSSGSAYTSGPSTASATCPRQGNPHRLDTPKHNAINWNCLDFSYDQLSTLQTVDREA
jgi:hypothetical protein